MSTWAINLGFQEIGEYEEVLEVSLRGIEQARKTQNVFLLFSNLDRPVGRTRYCWTYRRRVGSMRRR